MRLEPKETLPPQSADDNYELIQQLKLEGVIPVSDDVLARFVDSGEEITLKRNQVLVEAGEVNPDIHIVKEGVIRYCYIRDGRDTTAYFAMPATPVIAYHSYCMNNPSFYRLEACVKTKIIRVRKADFERLIKESHEFAQWVIGIHQCQLFFLEHKDRVITGTASERFVSLFRNRPELLKAVSSKVIASYLGITESYLSRLKTRLFKEGRLVPEAALELENQNEPDN